MRNVIAQAAGARTAFNGHFVQYDGTTIDW